MAINSQPLVALGIRTDYPAPDLIGNQVKLSALAGQRQQQAIQAQQAPLVNEGMQQENQQRALQLQSEQAQQKAASDPSIQWDKPGAYDRYFQAAQKNGALPSDLLKLQTGILDMKQKMATTDKDTLANQITQNDTQRGKLLSIVQQKDPALKQQTWMQEIQNEEAAGSIPKGQFPMQYPGDGPATMLANHLAQGSVLAKESIEQQNASAAKERADNTAIFDKAIRDSTNPDPAISGPAKQMVDAKAQYEAAVAAKTSAARVDSENSPEAVAGAANKARAVENAKIPAEVSKELQIQQATQKLLEGPALDQAAERYSQTGQMPQGMRGPAIATQIMRRAAELHPDQNLASNSADYSANKKSLSNVTGTLDTLSAFENTGLKNLKQFTDLAAKIPDTGVPWLNTPVRLLDEKIVGSPNMSAVNAARSVALREIARVTNDPKLSGALTDTARAEVEGLSPTSATLLQIKRVAEVLQQDMANVHSSLAQQKADIQRRLGGGQQQPSPKGGTPTHRFNPATGKIEEIK